MTNSDGAPRPWNRWLVPAACLAFVVFALIVFRSLLPADAVIFTTDDNIGSISVGKRGLPHGFRAWWYDINLLGQPGGSIPVFWSSLWIYLLPLRIHANWIHAIDLVAASIFLVLFLRERGIGVAGCILGALTGLWVGSNFTLVYAGHTGKFAVLVFAAASLWAFPRAARRGASLAWSLLAGMFTGMMFLEQADLALFFGLFWGAYALAFLLSEYGLEVLKVIPRLGLMAAGIALIAAAPSLQVYKANVGVGASGAEDPRDKYDFATQWSWPPEESIDFVAPGFTGWRSGEPEGPYTGRMGRTTGYETTGQGFQNFKLENQYIGAIPVVLAVFALLAALVPSAAAALPDRRRRLEVLFWSATVGVSLLLSFGKYFFLYRLFYMLPAVSSIRNPNKFLQVFQFALGIVAAYGLDSAIRLSRPAGEPAAEPAKRKGGAAPAAAAEPRRAPWIGVFAVATAVVGAIICVGALCLWLGRSAEIGRLASAGWGKAAEVIVGNRVSALWHGGLMMLLAAGAVWYLVRVRPWRRYVDIFAAALVTVVATDAVWLSKHYVQGGSTSSLAMNDVLRLLARETPEHRVALTFQREVPFYNYWLSYSFQYHDIKSINIPQMPRTASDYAALFSQVGRHPFRLWRLGAVSYVLGPAELWQQFQDIPEAKESFDLAMSYNVVPGEEGFTTVAATPQQPGRHVVLRLKAPAPRFALIAGWEAADDQSALKALSSPEVRLFDKVLVAPECAQNLQPLDGVGITGSVARTEYRMGFVRLKTSADCPAILRFSEKFDPDWQATVDGSPAQVLRVDYIFQGVFVPAGTHEVMLRYAPPLLKPILQISGMGLFLVTLVWVAVSGAARSRRSRKQAAGAAAAAAKP